LIGAAPATAQIDFGDFCTAPGLTLNGNAGTLTPNSDCTLRLTSGLAQSGSAFTTTPFSLAADASFSTFFCFELSEPVGIGDADGIGADGIVFAVQTQSDSVGGGGGGIGFAGVAPSLGVEFDTFFNGSSSDPNGNHVGIDLDGDLVSVLTAPVAARMNDGDLFCAWVDYNGARDELEVRLSQGQSRPTTPILVYSIDLPAQLGTTDAFVGFTSGSGSGGNKHEILNWTLVGRFAPIGQGTAAPVVSGGGVAFLALALLAGGVRAARRARQRRSPSGR
jgi:hypothetical protein